MKYIKRLSKEVISIYDVCSYLFKVRFVDHDGPTMWGLSSVPSKLERYGDVDGSLKNGTKYDIIRAASKSRNLRIIKKIKNWPVEFITFAIYRAIATNNIRTIKIISNWNIKYNFILNFDSAAFWPEYPINLSHKMIKLLTKMGIEFPYDFIKLIKSSIQLQYHNLWYFRYDEHWRHIVVKEYIDERYKLILIKNSKSLCGLLNLARPYEIYNY